MYDWAAGHHAQPGGKDPGQKGEMVQPEQRDREVKALQERLSRLSETSLRINGSIDVDTALQAVLDRALSLADYVTA